jgi:hypothetical protein
MRPPSRRQSALRAPLNNILGTEANVRILRALTEGDTPLSASELARRTRLGLSGVVKAIAGLVDTGILAPVGSGPRSPVHLRPDHPLTTALRELFAREREHFHILLTRLRAAATRIDPAPRAVWIQGAVATGNDRTGEPVVVGILDAARTLDGAREALETQVEGLARELDVTVEVRARTTADLEAAPPGEMDELREVIPLLGPPPVALLTQDDTPKRRRAARARTRSHRDADARALAFGSAIADRLRTNPSLIPHARDYIANRLPNASAGERRELQEWDRILRTMSVAKLRRLLTDTGERATRLRQTLPFVGVLTEEERMRLVSHIDRAAAGRTAR